ncbi:helix-turn-helix domain-containing protein [Bacteroides fragilis]|nr:helix-turn-helix domain-containing protein [Bacteroides fragilis]MCE8764323.1 helix-turn-helix domain-containing protein [Bacteroides fragilis]
MNKRIFLVIGVIILFIMIAIGASTYTIIHSLIQKEKEAFKPQVENILKEAVANNTIQKCKDIPLNVFNNSPNKIGTYETRTFCSRDTLFTYQHKIQDVDSEILFARQLGLLMMDSLQSSDIQALIIKDLNKNDIKGYINTGIIVSKHLQREIWSQPSNSIPRNAEMITYRLENEIVSVDYIMYIDYSFSTLWKRMPKTNIYINLVVEVILIYTITLFVLYYRKQQKNRSVSTVDITSDPNIITDPISVDNTVETEKQTNSTIKEELSFKDQFVFEKDFVLFNDRPIKMPNQQQKILIFFLNRPNYRVNKHELKEEFWPKNSDPTNNMTSAINKLKKILEEINSKYTIITDKTNEEYYVLIRDKSAEKI